MDIVRIADLEVAYRVGVTEEEKAKPQRLLVSVDMCQSLDRAVATDKLEDTVDYGKVCRWLMSFGEEKSWNLIEKLAGEICEQLLQRFQLRRVRVEVKKFLIREARYVSVTVEREA